MRKRILIIDDDPAIRQSFVLALRDMEYIVDTVETSEEGIKYGREEKYDLIFLDIKMQGITGIDILREIRKVNKKLLFI